MAVLRGLFLIVCESSNHINLCKLEQDGRAIEYLNNLTETVKDEESHQDWKTNSNETFFTSYLLLELGKLFKFRLEF